MPPRFALVSLTVNEVSRLQVATYFPNHKMGVRSRLDGLEVRGGQIQWPRVVTFTRAPTQTRATFRCHPCRDLK
jgi:hypothetical protein